MGHLAEWTIPAEEIDTPAGSSEKSTPIVRQERAEVESERREKGRTDIGITRREIETLINRTLEGALERKLAPVMDMLVDLRDRRAGMTEIIGGIGYIVGLVGIALYVANRQKKK
jgi:nickel transport protein